MTAERSTVSRLAVSSDVSAELAAGRPVVALESTIITHGMPRPQNLETANAVERAVAGRGAMPATIAVTAGKIRVGLSGDELAALAREDDVMKLSRADLVFALSTGRAGSTTVAATMMAAHLAGIEVFATGGIGGVHRGGQASLDISADLIELAQTPVIVVCAGAKAILDIPRTLEVLETQGVAVVGFGTDELPAFWSRSSGVAAPLRLDSAGEIADLWTARRSLGQRGGLLIANPVAEEDEIAADEMNALIEQAVAEAGREGITGKAVTPWLLSRIVELTDGRSLATNAALVKGNARLAADIAVALAG